MTELSKIMLSRTFFLTTIKTLISDAYFNEGRGWGLSKWRMIIRTASVVLASCTLAQGQMATSDPTGSEPNREAQTSQLNRPTVFYGRLLDQRDEPLRETSVKVWCVEARPLSLVYEDKGSGVRVFNKTDLETVTDSNGGFSFAPVDGKILIFNMLKADGYEVSRSNPSQFSADPLTLKGNTRGLSPDNPLVFRFWKRGAATPLAIWMVDSSVPLDGSETRLDLLRGKKVERGGDLVITVSREPGNIDEKPLTWTATFKAVDGGIAPSNPEFARKAPKRGYKHEFVFIRDAKDPDYNVMGITGFYLKSQRGAHHAHVRIRLSTGGSTRAAISLESHLNPSGSRNLESAGKLGISVETIQAIGWEEAVRQLR